MLCQRFTGRKHIFILFLFLSTISSAQHYQFSQFYSARTNLNPAFTGVGACSRLSINYRDQWPSIPGTFITYQVAWEHALPNKNSGLGVSFFSDKSGYGGLSSTVFGGLYSYELTLSRKTRLRFGIQAGAVSRKVNYQALLFGDQIARGGAPLTMETPTDVASYIDLSSGALYYTKKMWIGVSGMHLTQSNQSLLLNGGESRLPLELRVHGGRRFYKKDRNSWETEYFTAAANYKMQAQFDQLDIGGYYTKMPLVLGVWYRGLPFLKAYQPGYGNNDAIAVLLGITWEKLNLGYSYDFTISKLSYRSGGAHEISLSYNFCDPKKKKIKTVMISCPKF